ncbi:hypothetical protein D1AOALGA4SA_12430 [Olavius algarvensis Delta 1 endosymbiont]|nr:hypothetical protein D1AOALGA4SA_12430 [Olavius algarvensis Delta 1 endosymbiont]
MFTYFLLSHNESLKKRISNPPEADCKHRIMNIECRSNVFCLS